jgi:phosphoribosylanthranilate isomerase
MSARIKICGLKTAAAATAALDAGADYIGLVFFSRSPRHVAPAQAAALADLARGRAGIVALTVDADDALLDAIAAAVRPDLLQLHGHETPERAAAIRARLGIGVMKVIGVETAADPARADAFAGSADMILFDARPPRGAALPGGNGLPFDWRLLAGYAGTLPWMLSGGLTAQNVAEAIRLTGARAVDVSSGVETAPGEKSAGLIRRFIDAARAA